MSLPEIESCMDKRLARMSAALFLWAGSRRGGGSAREIIALFKEIDAAGDSGNKAGTRKALDKYKAKVRSLKAAGNED